MSADAVLTAFAAGDHEAGLPWTALALAYRPGLAVLAYRQLRA